RDDVYALACVAYELLSGRHPFDKQPANKARALDLAPDPISGQPKGAMRALCHGLEFERDLRCASVDTFLDELRKKNRFSGKVIFGATTALAASALLGAGWWWFYSGDVTGPPEGDRVVVDRPGEARGQAPEAADIQPRPIQDKPPKHDNLALSNLDKEQLTGESLKRENLEHQFIETERTGKERLDQQHSTHELLERNRIERERIEKEILRRQRLEQERIETARIEQKRLEQERLEQKRIETARIEQERLEQKRIETARIERERLEQARIEAARVEQERLEQQRIDNERLALEAEKKRLVEEKARLKEAEERLKAQRRAERAAREKSRVKEIARLQNKLLEQAKQQKVEQAEKLLIILEDKAPPNDRFVRETAPSTIANAYHRLSRASALKGEYAQAIKFSSRGLELKPTNQELKVDHSIYQAILRLEGLPSRIKGGELDLSTKENRLAVKLLTEKRPGQLQKYTQGIIDAVKQRIVQLDEQDSALAHTLLRSARGLLPNDQRLDQVAIMEPVHIAIVTQVVSVLGSGMTEKQYARKVGQVVASRLGIIMGRGKLMVRLLAGSKWARPVRQ
ncbi:MAG: hypothetical protein GY731_17955, partial [Gammaproteobacteria bacterium]|nr:hypothetical protein [Gammaproteobacteria bacterium]